MSNYEIVKIQSEILCPVKLLFIGPILNKFLVRFPLLKRIALANILIVKSAQPRESGRTVVSVVVPVRDEAENIPRLLDRMPDMGLHTEVVLVEGGSTDDSAEVIRREISIRQNKDIKLLNQCGRGKKDAVWQGLLASKGELLLILDSDLSVEPEALPNFYEAWLANKGDLINGTRLVYSRQSGAMQPLNFLGNKIFSTLFSFILEQRITDTACGTKAISAAHFNKLLNTDLGIEKYDEYGDWTLLLAASKHSLKITDLPVSYRRREAGESKMRRWKTGVDLVMIVLHQLWNRKFE